MVFYFEQDYCSVTERAAVVDEKNNLIHNFKSFYKIVSKFKDFAQKHGCPGKVERLSSLPDFPGRDWVSAREGYLRSEASLKHCEKSFDEAIERIEELITEKS